MSDEHPCGICGNPISDALSRTARLTVDRSEIDVQRLCPECFAEWIERYKRVMQKDSGPSTTDTDIIID